MGRLHYRFTLDPAGGLDTDGQLALFRDTRDPYVAAHLAARFADVEHAAAKYTLLACLSDPRESAEVLYNTLYALESMGVFTGDERKEHLPVLLGLLARTEPSLLPQVVRVIARVDVRLLSRPIDAASAEGRAAVAAFLEANPAPFQFHYLEKAAREHLAQGSTRFEVDSTMAGVVLPQHLYAQPTVVLELGWKLPVPIVDLALDSDGVRGTLSFGGNPWFCAVPWAAVRAITANDGKTIRFDNECSFCGAGQHQVKKLIASGPHFICDDCVALCDDIFAEKIPGWDPLNGHSNPPKGGANPCTFCGVSDRFAFVGGPDGVLICDDCVLLCNQIIDEEVQRQAD